MRVNLKESAKQRNAVDDQSGSSTSEQRTGASGGPGNVMHVDDGIEGDSFYIRSECMVLRAGIVRTSLLW